MPVKPFFVKAGSFDCISKYQSFFVQLSHPNAALPRAPPLFVLQILLMYCSLCGGCQCLVYTRGAGLNVSAQGGCLTYICAAGT